MKPQVRLGEGNRVLFLFSSLYVFYLHSKGMRSPAISASQCPAASNSYRRAASPDHRSGTAPQTVHSRSWEPSSTPCLLELWDQNKHSPNRLRSSGFPASAKSGWT